MVGNRRETPHAPTEMQQKATAAERDVAAPRSSSSAHALSPNVSSPLVADELRKLAELRDSGILSEVEFMNQKKRLLG
jgi:Short C-terminal domain